MKKMLTDKPRIGFVGVGMMGQAAHLRHYATLAECEVVAISELRSELGRLVARRYNVPRVYSSAAAMLEQEELDGIVAAQPFDRHGSVIAPLYQAAVPILTEKPLAASIDAGEQLLSALGAGGSWHMVGYHKRSDPATIYAGRQIRSLQQSGELGALRYVRILMPAGDWIAAGFDDVVKTTEIVPPVAPDPRDPDMDEALYARYSSFVNYYIHQVNLMRYLLGEPYHITYADPSGILLALQSVGGIAGAIEMTPYSTTLDWQEMALVAFEHGYVKLTLPAPLAANRPGSVEILRDPGNGVTPETVRPQLPWVSAMRQQALTFIKAIRGEAEPPVQAAAALEDLKVAREYIRLLAGR